MIRPRNPDLPARVEERIRKIITHRFGHKITAAEKRSLLDMSLLGKGLALDSVEALEFVLEIEREFDIFIGNQDFTPKILENVSTLVAYVGDKLSANGQDRER